MPLKMEILSEFLIFQKRKLEMIPDFFLNVNVLVAREQTSNQRISAVCNLILHFFFYEC